MKYILGALVFLFYIIIQLIRLIFYVLWNFKLPKREYFEKIQEEIYFFF